MDISRRKQVLPVIIVICLMCANINMSAQIPDPDQGLRAEWMRGTYGLNWKPAQSANGRSELEILTIKPFLEQIRGLKTVDCIWVNRLSTRLCILARMNCWKIYGREIQMKTGSLSTWLFHGHL